MKTTTPFKIILSIIVFATFLLVSDSCKKADIKANEAKAINEKTMAYIKANVASQIAKEGGIPQIFTRKQPAMTQWVDKNRRPVTKEQLQNNSFTSQCNYDLPSYCDLVQYARVYRCASTSHGGAGYFLQFEYEISWNNNIIKEDGGGNKTTGYADIVDGSNNVVVPLTFDYTNSDVEIVEIGPDPNPYFPNNYIFRIKFVTTDFNAHLVSDTYINSGSYAVKFSAMFVTDCSSGGDPYSLWVLPVTTYGFTGASGDDPCDRHDKSWVVPPSGGNILYAHGYNPGFVTCGYGGSFVAPDLQEIQYNIDGGTWLDMDNYTATSLPIFGSPFVRASDVSQTSTLPSGNHLIGVRYRNWKYSSSSPWQIPSLPGDCRSPENTSLPGGQQDYSTWAYAYFPVSI